MPEFKIKTESVSVRLPVAVIKMLDELAEKEYRTRGNYLLKIVSTHVTNAFIEEDHKKAEEQEAKLKEAENV
jgi:predicted DNA-binding protein